MTSTQTAVKALQDFQSHTVDLQPSNVSGDASEKSTFKSVQLGSTTVHHKSRFSDSGKSSSCSPILLDCSFDSGIAGVTVDSTAMQLHKRLQQFQCILLALERDHDYFLTIRNRLSKITSRKQKEARENAFVCNVCCAEIDENDEKTHVICNICEKYICRNTKCSEWLPETAKWECNLCQTSKESLAQTSSWVADQISFNQDTLICPPRARSEIYIPINEYNDSLIHFESVSQIGANCNTITAEQKIKIRKYVEEVVTKLLGGNLDTISVNQLSKSEEYLPQAENRHNRTSPESVASRGKCLDFSDITETRLRQLIEKIIAETISLPSLPNSHAKSEVSLDTRSRTSDSVYYQRHRHYFDPTIYQDLLATAVLNKIVDKQLNNKQVIPEGGIGVSSYADGDDVNDNNGVLVRSDKNFNIKKLSTSSGSSIEPQSDCSYTEVEQILNNNDDKSSEFHPNSDRESVMSDYLANHTIPLPDLNAKGTESEEDDYTSVTSSVVGDGTWEKNWLFRKKKTTLSTSVTSSSIGMLVPDPKEDIRAQIGDKTADEVSDLSELGTDSDDSLNSLRSQLEPINDRLVNKHLIGGQNSKMILDELIERSSMISNTSPSDGDHILTDACNEDIIDAATKNEAINDNVYQQQPISYKRTENLNNNPLAGSIAEREYKKWYNAVEMPNNPYAPEALKRRISGSHERFIDLPNISPTKNMNTLELLNEPSVEPDENVKLENDYKRYSRDYYINSSSTTSQASPARAVSVPFDKDNPEVNTNYNNMQNKNNSCQNKSHNGQTKYSTNDCYWTLSAPVRRSSSLNYLNKRINSPPPSHQHHAFPYHQHNRTSQALKTRPSTSTSYYNYHNNLNKDVRNGEDSVDFHSQRSPKSRTNSVLSLYSTNSNRSSNMSLNSQADSIVLTQFEKQLLHKDLKRNSFRAVSATTKDFVLNPLYDNDIFCGSDAAPNLQRIKSTHQTNH